jgi:hypothetical protein
MTARVLRAMTFWQPRHDAACLMGPEDPTSLETVSMRGGRDSCELVSQENPLPSSFARPALGSEMASRGEPVS